MAERAAQRKGSAMKTLLLFLNRAHLFRRCCVVVRSRSHVRSDADADVDPYRSDPRQERPTAAGSASASSPPRRGCGCTRSETGGPMPEINPNGNS